MYKMIKWRLNTVPFVKSKMKNTVLIICRLNAHNNASTFRRVRAGRAPPGKTLRRPARRAVCAARAEPLHHGRAGPLLQPALRRRRDGRLPRGGRRGNNYCEDGAEAMVNMKLTSERWLIKLFARTFYIVRISTATSESFVSASGVLYSILK